MCRAVRGGRAAALLAVLLLATVLPQVRGLTHREDAYAACVGERPELPLTHFPRFWQVGYLGDWSRTCTP